ncbi:MAG: hypothetical protein JXK07_02810 [Spirochaetes bacterium]|nr:hypothetical protein [Spirochaetota bacterium]MBN2771946.1 hypothetical protein [Spirochaetota bacterium]
MKRLLAFLIIPLLFIFACEDEDKEVTLRYETGGICNQITTSNEEIINELKDIGYSNGNCDKSEAIAKCEYSDADADELAYQYTTDKYSIQGFKELCEESDGEYELLISEEEAEKVTEEEYKIVLLTTGKTYDVTEDSFVGDYARFKMIILKDTTYSITVTAVDSDGNTITDDDFNVGIYASEEDLIDNTNYIDDYYSSNGVATTSDIDGSDFYASSDPDGSAYLFFDILSYKGNRTYTIDAKFVAK